MMQTKLNQGLHKINLHPTGLCEHCGVSQDCKHFIFECILTEGLRKVIAGWGGEHLSHVNYEVVLSNVDVLNVLANFCSTQDMSI